MADTLVVVNLYMAIHYLCRAIVFCLLSYCLIDIFTVFLFSRYICNRNVNIATSALSWNALQTYGYSPGKPVLVGYAICAIVTKRDCEFSEAFLLPSSAL